MQSHDAAHYKVMVTPPTWPTDVDIHAVAVKLPLGGCEGHGGGHTDVCGSQVVLSPLPAVNCVVTVRQSAGLLHLLQQVIMSLFVLFMC